MLKFKKIGLVGLVLSQIAFANFSAPQGAVRDLNETDIMPHPHKSSTYNEFWTYHFYFTNGVKSVINFSRVNAGSIKGEVCGADLSFVWFDGKNYDVAREYPVQSFKYSKAESKLEVHENIWFKGKIPGEQKLYFKTKKNGITYFADLTITNMAPSKIKGDGEYKISGEKAGLYIHIPWARVSGTIGINDKMQNVNGTVYMDHTWETDTAPDIVKKGFRYIAHNAGNFDVGYFLIPKKGSGQIAGYGLRGNAGGVTLMEPKALVEKSTIKSGGFGSWVEDIEIQFLDNTSTNIHFDKYYQRLSLLKEFSGVTKWTIEKFMGGELVTFRGPATVDGKKANYSNFLVKY
jgi:hypothetical protein